MKVITVTIEELDHDALKATSDDIPGFLVYSFDKKEVLVRKLPDLIQAFEKAKLRIKKSKKKLSPAKHFRLTKLQYTEVRV